MIDWQESRMVYKLNFMNAVEVGGYTTVDRITDPLISSH